MRSLRTMFPVSIWTRISSERVKCLGDANDQSDPSLGDRFLQERDDLLSRSSMVKPHNKSHNKYALKLPIFAHFGNRKAAETKDL